MHEFKRTNKITGVYWLSSSLENLRVKVKLKPRDSIITLPKFEDYSNNDTSSAKNESIDTYKEHTFNWQEKVFSSWEIQQYSDLHNCATDVQMNYHNILNGADYEPSKVSSYIHEDYYLPLPLDHASSKRSMRDLNFCFDSLNLNNNMGKLLSTDTSSMRHLFKSEENIITADEKWRAMHIVYDNSEYDEDSHLIYKQEAVLVSLYHNIIENYLLLIPDCNNLEMNAYCMETKNGVMLPYEYSVEVQFQDDEESSEELLGLLNKLNKKWEKKHRHLVNFSMPQLGKKQYYLALEILTASDFEMDNLYIEFDIKLPEELHSNNSLHGRTHISQAVRTESEQWHFGHLVELSLETADAVDSPSIQLFFEVISTDWWGRHRTEGYNYFSLSLEPGSYSRMLSCSRPEESNRVEAENRRFFVGGCHLIKDLDVLVNPHLRDPNFVFSTTGSINLRWNILSHSPIPGYMETTKEVVPSTSASALLRGAEAVLRQYKRARAKLVAATKDLGGRGDGFDDG